MPTELRSAKDWNEYFLDNENDTIIQFAHAIQLNSRIHELEYALTLISKPNDVIEKEIRSKLTSLREGKGEKE